MKFLVLSDSHGCTKWMQRVLELHHASVDAVLFLGDGAKDFLTMETLYPGLPFYGVLGNCDSASFLQSNLRSEYVLAAGTHRIFLCHGHRYDVGCGYDRLLYAGQQRQADILLYGHLHTVHEEYLPQEDNRPPMWILSPGSIGQPRDGLPSFALLEVTPQGVCFSAARCDRAFEALP